MDGASRIICAPVSPGAMQYRFRPWRLRNAEAFSSSPFPLFRGRFSGEKACDWDTIRLWLPPFSLEFAIKG
jgi:hypothetical protein